MRRVAMTLTVACVTAATLLTATVASAQERGSIVGLVQDSSGAILPGVTVEASSPVLIEQMRTAITDSAGRYAVVDLRPGTYAVTFTLPGFKSFKREGIVIEGAFAAQVNASLAVGAVEETVIVTGASPVVDLQSTQNQTVINREALDVLPAARTMQGGASLVPGVAFYSQGFTSNMSIHGSLREDQHIYFDGMNIGQNLTQNGQQGNGVGVNELAQQELIYDAGSQSAEVAVGGVRMDSIPKEGGNTFSGIFRAFGGTGSLQNDNITDELKPFITAGNSLDYTYDVNTVFGGPIRRNKLWFLVAQRVSQANNLIPLPTQYFPKGGTASSGGQVTPHSTVRLTWQASERNKIVWAFYKSQGGTQRFDVGCTATSFNAVACISPEAAYWLPTPLQYGSQVKWTSPISSRLLLEVGQSLAVPTYKFKYQPENGPLDIQHINSSTSVRTVASSTAPQDYFDQIWNTVVNLSYVTGSHNFKTGLNQQWGYQRTKVERNGDTAALTYVNVNGVPTPSTVTVTNSPFNKFENLNANLGLYAQDKWTLPRLTVTYGARYDYFNASTPDQSAEKGLFMSAAAKAARANIPAVSCLPCWNDWSIRLGASYDLRGDGRTAIKVSVGKFLAQQALGLASSTNPLASQTDSRSWTDLDKNGTIFDANGNVETAEIGVTRNNNFGLPSGATQFDPNLPRPTNWEETVSVQHEGAAVARTQALRFEARLEAVEFGARRRHRVVGLARGAPGLRGRIAEIFRIGDDVAEFLQPFSRARGRGRRRANRPAQIGGGAGKRRFRIIRIVVAVRLSGGCRRLAPGRRRGPERIGDLAAIDPLALGRRIEARLARGLGLDLADRLLEPEPFARDVRLGERRHDAAQLRHQRGARALVERAPGLAGALVETGDRLGDEGVVVGHQVPAFRRGCGIIPSLILHLSPASRSSPRHPIQASNGLRIRMVSCRSGLVDSNTTGQPISSSTRRTYLIAWAGRSAQERARAVASCQPATVWYTGSTRACACSPAGR